MLEREEATAGALASGRAWARAQSGCGARSSGRRSRERSPLPAVLSQLAGSRRLSPVLEQRELGEEAGEELGLLVSLGGAEEAAEERLGRRRGELERERVQNLFFGLKGSGGKSGKCGQGGKTKV